MSAADARVISRYKSMSRHLSAEAAEEAWGAGASPNASTPAAESTEAPTAVKAQGDNPLCGDTLTVYLRLSSDTEGQTRIDQGWFSGYGCSLCMASADLALERLEGMTAQEAVSFGIDDLDRAWGGLDVARSRRRCMDLCLRAVRNALEGAGIATSEPLAQD